MVLNSFPILHRPFKIDFQIHVNKIKHFSTAHANFKFLICKKDNRYCF